MAQGIKENYLLTNTVNALRLNLTWTPQTLVINNTSKYPCYVRVGGTNPPSVSSFDDLVPPFTAYVIDPAGAQDFAVFIDNTADPLTAFTYPVNVVASTGSASAQGPLNSNFSSNYILKILALEAANLIDFQPLNETTGTIAVDQVSPARNSTYQGPPTLHSALFQDGVNFAPLFVVVHGDFVDLPVTGVNGFNSVFNGLEGTMLVWIQMTLAHWNDANIYSFASIDIDVNNHIRITKSAANTLKWEYLAAGSSSAVTVGGIVGTTWQALVITWSHSLNRARAYLKGVQQGADQTPVGLFAGNPVTCRAMALNGGNLAPDNAAMWAIWSKELTAAEVLQASTAP